MVFGFVSVYSEWCSPFNENVNGFSICSLLFTVLIVVVAVVVGVIIIVVVVVEMVLFSGEIIYMGYIGLFHMYVFPSFGEHRCSIFEHIFYMAHTTRSSFILCLILFTLSSYLCFSLSFLCYQLSLSHLLSFALFRFGSSTKHGDDDDLSSFNVYLC